MMDRSFFFNFKGIPGRVDYHRPRKVQDGIDDVLVVELARVLVLHQLLFGEEFVEVGRLFDHLTSCVVPNQKKKKTKQKRKVLFNTFLQSLWRLGSTGPRFCQIIEESELETGTVDGNQDLDKELGKGQD